MKPITNKRIVITILLVVAWFVGVGFASEYLVNRVSSTIASFSFAIIAIVGFYFMIYKPLKQLL